MTNSASPLNDSSRAKKSPPWMRVATLDDATQHGLKKPEFEVITAALGRSINLVELGICSALFS
jgi:hypothetical protein